METFAALEELNEHARRVYDQFGYHVRPHYPNILVWVVPKEGAIRDTTGKVLLVKPEAQNKPVHEGLVLRTYEPFWKRLRHSPVCEIGGEIHSSETRACHEEILVKAPVSPGDHVLFAHFEGQPVDALGSGKEGAYRLVRDEALLAALEYKGYHNYPKQKLYAMLGTLFNDYDALSRNVQGAVEATQLIERFVDKLMENADVFFRPQARTVSGR